MSFDRFRFQKEVEILLGCHQVEKWLSYSQKFQSLEVNMSNIQTLKSSLHEDGLDNLYKGLYSISNGFFNIYHGYYSWSVVKFYYAVFYLLRCFFSANDIGFLKSKGIFTLKLEQGEKPIRRDNFQYNGETIKGDHKTTIVTYEREFKDQDILLSNHIGDLTVYDWLMEIRNQVNYRERAFKEPELGYFPISLFNKSTLKESIEIYFKDQVPIYCFNEDHACVAAPIKVLQFVSHLFYTNTGLRLSEERIKVIEKMLEPTGINEIPYIKNILYPDQYAGY
ncbi:hypothetical protein N0P26_001651 [Acinetobacter baumannii]|uniref:Uncharacterized protein n=1 Tax=Acinetobacter baumannii TaxID=470 RepID=A0A9P2L884_ACIBA|nr:hypothetical protein [Acinetobacter baumannii]EKT7959722.1 hypothetical protein [Acinetobacter baumannii]EKT9123303.1 hypothetical protein [Acinetobacter baumannii]EKT9273043.1 hypothetical protein [Acinetobacter baumannii]EKU0109591.1 hypothetical protein [Acinetobacter baumannii]EKU0261881.1 hypothetical protein [Acinetobacter baumannii]